MAVLIQEAIVAGVSVKQVSFKGLSHKVLIIEQFES